MEKRKTGLVDEVENLTAHVESVYKDCPVVKVSMFDYSIENHMRAIDTISRLCPETGNDDIGQSEIERLSSMITFLREWRYYNYEPRVLNFAEESASLSGKNINATNLPQFSAATVPKKKPSRSTPSMESSKDIVFYAGGPVWALDWCPRVHENSISHINCEFIAVAAHPPNSLYHKIGAPLTGRGVIQIWCLLNVIKNEEVKPPMKTPKRQPKKDVIVMDESTVPKKPRGRPRKNAITEAPPEDIIVKEKSTEPKKPKGRPRKKPIAESPPKGVIEAPPKDVIVKEKSTEPKKPKGRPRKKPITESPPKDVIVMDTSTKPKKLKERPRKKPIKESRNNLDCSDELLQPLAVLFPEDSPNMNESDLSRYGRKRKRTYRGMSACTSTLDSFVQNKKPKTKNKGKRENNGGGNRLLTEKDDNGSSATNAQTINNSEHDLLASTNIELNEAEQDLLFSTKIELNDSEQNLLCSTIIEMDESLGDDCLDSDLIPDDITLPRIVLCLAHNGKVAWDVKWQPSNVFDIKRMSRMGYLAVILGNGSLEVWEVPFPSTITAIFSSSPKEGTDPRFLKLNPVFKCSKLKCGERESIPLTVEWSSSSPHDYILAGCHDGTVALWKFSASGLPEDTKPLLCFNADSAPIRAVAWAPVENDPESANIIATAGHGGLKFWDIRDPFRPLWDLSPFCKVIYGMDWLQDPRCIILSLDDGTIKIINLSEASYDVPVTGKPFDGSKLKGVHGYICSSYSIWSIQASYPTGMVAYCTADGEVHRFQLTAKVLRDPSRNRALTFLCGSLTEEKSTLTVNTPLPNSPLCMKKMQNGSNVPKGKPNDKKTKGQTSDDGTLALCYGDDAGEECDTDSEKNKNTRKSKPKPRNKNYGNYDQPLVCRDCPENVKENADKQIEIIAPKIIAMHRVRWNKNKGSERWLCYGGAAGIVRCQEIV